VNGGELPQAPAKEPETVKTASEAKAVVEPAHFEHGKTKGCGALDRAIWGKANE
jgi:hypothetical protein